MSTLLRQRYEDEVHALATLYVQLLEAGYDRVHIAYILHRRRRRIGLRFKLRTPLFGRHGQLMIYRRNIRRYGHPLGPSIRYLRARGKTWEQICQSASRPGGHDLS